MKTYIIRLKNNDFSCRMAEEAEKSVKSLGIDPIFFDGIEKDSAIDFFEQHSIKIESTSPIDAVHWSLGTMGCFASHYSLWKMCIDQNEPFTIMEHDGIMVRNPETILNLIDDVCHLDRFTPFVSNLGLDYELHANVYTENVNSNGYIGIHDYPEKKFYTSDTNHVTGACFMGAYGYIIKPKGAKKLLQFCKQFGAYPADRMICQRALKLQKASRTYVRLNPFFKSLQIQRDYSTR